MSLSVPRLLDLLRRERILPDASLPEAERLAAAVADARAFAVQLVQRGFLTPFQANHLVQGKADRLTLKDYILLEPLGEGGMGKVFKARHRLLNRLVALKVVHPDALHTPQAIKRFEREMQLAAQVDHPNLVRTLDGGIVGDDYFYVMDLVPGIDLARLVDEVGPLPLPLACDFARQVALGLQHIHEKGLVHRDIKPQNLIAVLKKDAADRKAPASYEGIKILDLGLAILRPADGDGKTVMGLTRAGSVMGTPDFMAPEQTTDAHKVDIRADLYSLGCTLYYLLTGHLVYYAGSVGQKLFQHRQAPIPDPRQHRPEVPEALVQTLRVLMAKGKEDRYATPGEAAQALDQHLGGMAKPRSTPMGTARSPGASDFDLNLPNSNRQKTEGELTFPETPGQALPRQKAAPPPSPKDRSERSKPRNHPPIGEGRETPTRKNRKVLLAAAFIFLVGVGALVLSFLNRGQSGPGGKEPPPKTLTNSINMKLVWIEPGRFQMGSPVGEKDRLADEFQHEVEITQGFYMGVFEVTQEQYRQVVDSNPSYFDAAKVRLNTDLFPVEQVSWNDALEFCQKLTEKEKGSGRVYDLPTEAEWEYACRAGSTTVFAFGDALGSDQANLFGASPYGGAAKSPFLNRTTTVGSYKANAWGLYDMHGNVFEWCKDWFGKDYYRERHVIDPTGPATGNYRILRGGSWNTGAWRCRSAQRSVNTPDGREADIGFRVVVRLSPRTP